MATFCELQEQQHLWSLKKANCLVWPSGKRKKMHSRKPQDLNKPQWSSLAQLHEYLIFGQTMLRDKTITPSDYRYLEAYYQNRLERYSDQAKYYNNLAEDDYYAKIYYKDYKCIDSQPYSNVYEKNRIKKTIFRKKIDKEKRRQRNKSEWKNVKASKKRRIKKN